MSKTNALAAQREAAAATRTASEGALERDSREKVAEATSSAQIRIEWMRNVSDEIKEDIKLAGAVDAEKVKRVNARLDGRNAAWAAYYLTGAKERNLNPDQMDDLGITKLFSEKVKAGLSADAAASSAAESKSLGAKLVSDTLNEFDKSAAGQKLIVKQRDQADRAAESLIGQSDAASMLSNANAGLANAEARRANFLPIASDTLSYNINKDYINARGNTVNEKLVPDPTGFGPGTVVNETTPGGVNASPEAIRSIIDAEARAAAPVLPADSVNRQPGQGVNLGSLAPSPLSAPSGLVQRLQALTGAQDLGQERRDNVSRQVKIRKLLEEQAALSDQITTQLPSNATSGQGSRFQARPSPLSQATNRASSLQLQLQKLQDIVNRGGQQ
tara:strand:+ start:297 stop:1460 length:1164 start_codon:yes stop_codon:yes gene_type:complete